MGSLDGFGALVTGGGSGIGEGCAAALLADGAVVTICGRTKERLDDAAERLRSSGASGSVHTVVADVTNEDEVAAAVAHAT